jgi:AraC family transcriptional regulator
MIASPEDLERWFRTSGVATPLAASIGPLPTSRAALGRWTSDGPDHAIRDVCAHPGSYRLALMLEPLEARIWAGNTPVWGGTIAAHRFRLCPPAENGRWSRLSGCDIVNLFLPVDLIDQVAAARGDSPLATLSASQFAADRMVSDLVRKMLEAEAMAGPLAAAVCDHLVQVLVAYLLEHYSRLPSQPAQGGLNGARLRRVLRHIAQQPGAHPSNAELAALCGMSGAHFSREFQRAMGVPPHRYLLLQRLQGARAALQHGEARIVDIAQEQGFHSASHFSRAFAAEFGVAPAVFRQRCRMK